MNTAVNNHGLYFCMHTRVYCPGCRQFNSMDKKLEAKPGVHAHVDYTLSSGPNRLKDVIPASEAEALQQHPYAIIQAGLL